jgi:drug/metabolite transporter (DMT)-like permease
MTGALKARLLLVWLCLAWGLTWPAMRIALVDFPPFTMRAFAALIGAGTMFVLAALAGSPLRVPPRPVWSYIFIVSFFNIILFSVCVAFAQLHTMTGRVAILVYTMPIWASVISWFVLGERPNGYTAAALALCCAGMAVLVYPLARAGIPLGILLSLCAALSWTIGTIYVKKSRKNVEPFTLSTWQLISSLVVMSLLAGGFERSFDLSTVGWKSWAATAFTGFFGSAIAYYLWFHIIRLLPASTAALGALSTPVIGLVSSIFLLDEIPTVTDIVGFALIFSASLCALLKPQSAPPPSYDAA